jgi:hypothetical protein
MNDKDKVKMDDNLDPEHFIELTDGDHRTLRLKASIDDGLLQSRLIVDRLDDDAGLRLFLGNDEHVAVCLGGLDIIYVTTDDIRWETSESVGERVAAGIDLAIDAIFNLADEHLARGQQLLADLAGKIGESRSLLQRLLDWELESKPATTGKSMAIPSILKRAA